MATRIHPFAFIALCLTASALPLRASRAHAQQVTPSLSAGSPPASQSQSAEARARRDAEAEAHALFSAGASALAAGRLQEALRRFHQAYSLCGRPEILFDIGLAYDALGQRAEAAAAFDAYLKLSPDPSRREHAEARVKSLRAGPENTSVANGGPPSAAPADEATGARARAAEPRSKAPRAAASQSQQATPTPAKPAKRVVVAAPAVLAPIPESPLLHGL